MSTKADMEPSYEPVQTTPFPFAVKLKAELWRTIERTLFRCSPRMMRGWRRWLLRLFGAQLARTASIHPSARIEFPWNLRMGDMASIGEDAWIYSLDLVQIDEKACVGQRAIILTGSHDALDQTFPLISKPVRIHRGSWLALGVTVLPGVTIGEFAVVGAGSVVTGDVPPRMICAGNPCRPIKPRAFRTACYLDS